MNLTFWCNLAGKSFQLTKLTIDEYIYIANYSLYVSWVLRNTDPKVERQRVVGPVDISFCVLLDAVTGSWRRCCGVASISCLWLPPAVQVWVGVHVAVPRPWRLSHGTARRRRSRPIDFIVIPAVERAAATAVRLDWHRHTFNTQYETLAHLCKQLCMNAHEILVKEACQSENDKNVLDLGGGLQLHQISEIKSATSHINTH